jgi:serine/threonine protein kinase
MIGKTINNYLIERKLGEGGMGEVYYARHNKVDREVAIKVLHSHLFQNASIHNRFKNEANALIKLSHPNIVKIFDYVEHENFACLIMEYINGYTLDLYLNNYSGPLPSAKAATIMCAVLDAVQYAHDCNIYHRDIKPANIMISKDGNKVRIMDFGIAKLTDSTSFQTTHANTQLGTPFYMSPEQIKGLPYSRMSDIYSLGVTLFEMVTGTCPYHDIKSLFELQLKIVNEPLPQTSKYYPNVSIKIQNAILKATQKSPELRFQSCNEFKQSIVELDSTVIVQIPNISLPRNRPKSKINWNALISTAIVLIILGVSASLLISNKSVSRIEKKSGIQSPNLTEISTGPVENVSLKKVVADTIPSIQEQNILALNKYIDKKQLELKISLSPNQKDPIINKVKSLDHLMSITELSSFVDALFIIPPRFIPLTDYQIKRDFKNSVIGLKELCRIILDNYDNQIREVTIVRNPINLSSPPPELFVTIKFKISDAEDSSDLTDCTKTLIYIKSGTQYHFERMQ